MNPQLVRWRLASDRKRDGQFADRFISVPEKGPGASLAPHQAATARDLEATGERLT